MMEKRAVGSLNGTVIKRLDVSGFILTETANRPGQTPMHAHENSYFCYLLNGHYSERYGGEQLLCKPSSLIFLPSNEGHAVQLHNQNRVFFIEIPPRWTARLQQLSLGLDQTTAYSNSYLNSLCGRLYREFCTSDAASTLAMEGLVLEMLAEASRGKTQWKDRSLPLWLRKARELLKVRFAEKFTIAEIASEVGIHEVHLATTFRKHFGCTIGEFARQLRIEQARTELAKRDLSLAAIALAAGFADQSHFSKVFKAHTGITPNQYRKEHAPRLV